MHKLSKGLKKKIKGKKGKEKEDDLFDPAILEQYRRDKAAAAAAAAAAVAASGDDHDPSAEENGSPTTSDSAAASAEAVAAADNKDSEEWQKFKLLTSGVDTILQKTQEDLGRIKKTSYYQRNKKPETPTPVGEEVKPIVGPSTTTSGTANATTTDPTTGHKTKWIGFEEGARYQEEESEQAADSAAAEQTTQAEEEAIPQFEEPEFEEPAEDEEDIFNTEYVDAITSGDLKFAYVPDSPTNETSDDPFDTSVVEKLVGPLPVIKKKKALVSIGAAVEILTAANAADQQQKQHQASTANRQRIVQPPTEIQLLCCFDDSESQNDQPTGNSSAVTPSTNHLVESSSSQQPTPQTEANGGEEQLAASGEPDLKDILAEFDVIAESEPVNEQLVEAPKPAPPEPKKPELVDEEDFEFEALAYESLAKNPQPLTVEEDEDENDPFDTSCVEKVLNKEPVESAKKVAPPPRPTGPPVRPPPPPSASAIAAIAAKIDRPCSISVGRSPVIAAPPSAASVTGPPLQAQDSFDALFLNDSPATEKQQLQLQSDQVQSQEKSQEPVDDSFNSSTAVDPFDTSAVDPFDTSAVDPFDTSAATNFITDPSSALPVQTQFNVTTFAVVDESPVDDEVDPFDTSAVEKILN